MVKLFLCRNFELKHLAQIKFVYPDAYIFRQEQNVRSFTNQSSQHQLTIECTSHKGMDNEEEGVMKPLPAGKGLQFSSLVKRKRLLHQRLQQIAIEHHKVGIRLFSILHGCSYKRPID